MKKKTIIIIAIAVMILAVSLTIIYYTMPLSAKSIIAHSTKIEKIFFHQFNNSSITSYQIDFENDEEKNVAINEFMSILDSVSYTRSPRSFDTKNIRNDGGATLGFMIYYRDHDGEVNDYFLDINQKGYVLSGGKNMYKMVEREEAVFEQLSTWLFEKGVKL